MAYITQQDLENAMGKAIVDAVFDDDADGVPEAAAIQACCDSATAECNSFIRTIHNKMQTPPVLPLSTVPDEVKFAALDFGLAYAARRRPDMMRAMNEEGWKAFRDAGVSKMKSFVEGMQRFPFDTANADDGAPAVVGDESRYVSRRRCCDD